MYKTIVTSEDITRAVFDLGISRGCIVLVHSSMKSLGWVEGGPEAVVRGIEAAIGDDGTLVMPTLSQTDFKNSYKTWRIDKPSDVGLLTETFRKMPRVYRSDHATHSVAARGRLARRITHSHAIDPHLCPFGEHAFSDSSPWLQMYELDATIMFIGVDMVYNTMKHVVEARFVERLLSQMTCDETRASLTDRLATFDREGVWLFYDGKQMHDALDTSGVIRKTRCGDAEVIAVSMKASCDMAYALISGAPDLWYGSERLEWINDCLTAIGRGT